MVNVQDEQILSLLTSRQTKEEGFRLLMTTYQERAYWAIRRVVGSHEDADDVLQNAFIKVFKNIDRFQGKSTLYTWLHRICINESLTHIKRNKRYLSTDITDYKDAFSVNHQEIDGDEVEHKLNLAIASLPVKQKQVFNLRYYDEMSYNEISKMLTTSVGGLKASYHHAVKKIESFIKKS